MTFPSENRDAAQEAASPLAYAESVSKQLVRALRGRRSRVELSRRLGYRSNIVRRWEAGESWPTAADFLQACARVRPRAKQLFAAFFQRSPDWWRESEGFTSDAVAAFLRALRGKTPIGSLAQRTGFNRFSVGRWLTAKAQPKLPEFLCLVEASSRRMLDLIAGLVDPSELPATAEAWARLTTAREAAYSAPWSHAVLRALELDAPSRGRTEEWIAERLGIEVADVQAGLALLHRTGQIRKLKGRWHIDRVVSVDTSAEPERARKLKAAWAEVALGRLRGGARGSFGYSVFAISRSDLRRLRDVHLEYVRAMQNLIAESSPGECVGLYNAQLLDLATVDNALA
jgi:hypothetical protein